MSRKKLRLDRNRDLFLEIQPGYQPVPGRRNEGASGRGLARIGQLCAKRVLNITQAPKFSSVDNGRRHGRESRGESPDAPPTNCDWKDDCLIGRIHCKGATPPVNRNNSGNAHVRL